MATRRLLDRMSELLTGAGAQHMLKQGCAIVANRKESEIATLRPRDLALVSYNFFPTMRTFFPHHGLSESDLHRIKVIMEQRDPSANAVVVAVVSDAHFTQVAWRGLHALTPDMAWRLRDWLNSPKDRWLLTDKIEAFLVRAAPRGEIDQLMRGISLRNASSVAEEAVEAVLPWNLEVPDRKAYVLHRRTTIRSFSNTPAATKVLVLKICVVAVVKAFFAEDEEEFYRRAHAAPPLDVDPAVRERRLRGLFRKLNTRRCGKCAKRGLHLKLCGGCKKVFYCGAGCQRKDRARHRLRCK